MTTNLHARIVFIFVCVSAGFAQESPTPTLSPIAAEPPSSSISPEIALPSPTLAQTPSPGPARSVRISFAPPPIEGTISLGIYDQTGRLVRVLHQNAQLNDFTIGADALVTRWDGKDDEQRDLPAGKYHARGYLVGSLKAEPTSNSHPPADAISTENIRVKLAPNPLAKDRRPTIELAVRFDQQGSFLETVDGLPIFTIDKKPGVTDAILKRNGPNSADVWEKGDGACVQFHVSNLDQMMAFDCGEFSLK